MREVTIFVVQGMQETTLKPEKKTATFAIAIGIILYLSKFLRSFFKEDLFIQFVLGFLPNFGLAFAIPFIFVSHRIRLNKPVKYFGIACVASLLLMILNEIRDKYQPGRIFDWNDLYASFAGVIAALLVFHLTSRSVKPISQPAKKQ